MKGTAKKPLFAKKVGGKWVGHFLLVRQTRHAAREFLGVSPEAEKVVAAVLLDAASRRWQRGGMGV